MKLRAIATFALGCVLATSVQAKTVEQMRFERPTNVRKCARTASVIFAEEREAAVKRYPKAFPNPNKVTGENFLETAKKLGGEIADGKKSGPTSDVVIFLAEYVRRFLVGGSQSMSLSMQEEFHKAPMVTLSLGIAHLMVRIPKNTPIGLAYLAKAASRKGLSSHEKVTLARLIDGGCASKWSDAELKLPEGKRSEPACRAAAQPVFNSAEATLDKRYGDQVDEKNWRAKKDFFSAMNHPWIQLAIRLSGNGDRESMGLKWIAAYRGTTRANAAPTKMKLKVFTFGFNVKTPYNGFSNFYRGVTLIAKGKEKEFKDGLGYLARAWGSLPPNSAEAKKLRTLIANGCHFG